ncbi:MAG: chromosome segregation protein SMC [Pseudomonadota bacterium]|nr:chromosome segregation protein SMC [Pseudomonadota bacterium]
MRLKSIHLVGFKSFVEPTTITLPGNLVGIVGPNGCGKSNVIDAVRWVMGETSARNLRGDSMADVIFNGTDSRKPVGRASVELVFDNDGKDPPEGYAQFSEISIKRTLARDGNSEYQLNRARCRRRDITDIFRGTGLGHRSYSIIEQGMVSRIVEARPEELRTFVEEAAGVSKYKDRRRETETRIRHTRENLSRVNDIRSELETQLRRLQRQSQAARRYQKLKDEEHTVNGELLALRHLQMAKLIESERRHTADAESNTDSKLANQRELERAIETIREKQLASQEALSSIQGDVYAVAADIASIEQQMEHARQTEEQQRSELERLEEFISGLMTECSSAAERQEDLRSELEASRSARVVLAEAVSAAENELSEHELALEGWQTRWQIFTQRAAEPAREQEVQRARIAQLENVDSRAQERLARFDDEYQLLLDDEDSLDLDHLRAVVERGSITLESQQVALAETLVQMADEREAETQLRNNLDQVRQLLHTADTRLSSLRELQVAALGDEDEQYRAWLAKRGLERAPRLTGEVNVAAGWENAADAVLGDRLTGLGIGHLQTVVSAESSLPAARNVFLIEAGDADDTVEAPPADTLLAKLNCPRYDLRPLLSGIYVAGSLAEAMERRLTLRAGECVVTQDGSLIGKNWLRSARAPGPQTGLLAREEEIHELELTVENASNDLRQLELQQERGVQEIRRLEEVHRTLHKEVAQCQREQADARERLAEREVRQSQIGERRQQLQSEIEEITHELIDSENEMFEANRNFSLAEDETGMLEIERGKLVDERGQLTEVVAATRQAVQQKRNELHACELDLQRTYASLDSVDTLSERLMKQIEEHQNRKSQLNSALDEKDEPTAEMSQQLQVLLARRQDTENRLSKARAVHSELEDELRDQYSRLSEYEQEVAAARDALDQQRMKMQELSVRAETLLEQISAGQFELEALLESLPAQAQEDLWREKANQLAEKISRIGPVNLVAIEEFEEQSERKTYLDRQNEDLSEALITLESVIRRIDRETRQRFKDTFESLNNYFCEFFPRLFGGGDAVLELTEDDFLTAGVTVMARPPGKRNSTIHLLSGGEKALTAVALLFSLFRLNPAPLCILDEVDAPLDDMNVERYCATLRTLSDRTQLVVITHNKITMEATDVLLGVTMGEPGVSAIVSVDVEHAVEMATN